MQQYNRIIGAIISATVSCIFVFQSNHITPNWKAVRLN